MQIEYIHKPAMAFIGFTRLIDPKTSPEGCARFWKECFEDRFSEALSMEKASDEDEAAVLENGIGRYGLCISTCNDNMNYMISGEYAGGNVPEGMKVYRIPEGDWAVFSERGEVQQTIRSINERIWNEWYLDKGIMCNPCGDAIVERYCWENTEPDNILCEVWVQIMHIPSD